MSNIRITYNQRLEIEKFIHLGLSYRGMGKRLSLHHTTIYQEIKKNGGRENYDPTLADEKTFFSRQRSNNEGKFSKLIYDKNTQNRIKENLKKRLNPKVMVERAKLEGVPFPVSHQTIYNFIYQHKTQWIEYLPYRKKRKWKWKRLRKTKVYAKKTNISQRDKSINLRQEFGHYEIDTIHLDKGAILTLIERKTRFFSAKVMRDLKTSTTNMHLCEMIKELGKKLGKVKSITSDNGVEFWGHKEIEDRFSLNYYHCDPYASWQRGTNENANRILRRFFPKKGNSYKNITQKEVTNATNMINLIPRKLLNYYSPYELVSKKFTPLIFIC